MEITTGGEDFDADTERYGWINRSVPDAELDAFTDQFATRVASFDRPATRRPGRSSTAAATLPAAPARRPPTPGSGRLSPGQRSWARIQRFMQNGGQQRSDLELNLGEHLPELRAAPGQNLTAVAVR
jgi:hypothetical protein